MRARGEPIHVWQMPDLFPVQIIHQYSLVGILTNRKLCIGRSMHEKGEICLFSFRNTDPAKKPLLTYAHSIWGLARVVRRHLLPETVVMRRAKSEEGSNGLSGTCVF